MTTTNKTPNTTMSEDAPITGAVDSVDALTLTEEEKGAPGAAEEDRDINDDLLSGEDDLNFEDTSGSEDEDNKDEDILDDLLPSKGDEKFEDADHEMQDDDILDEEDEHDGGPDDNHEDISDEENDQLNHEEHTDQKKNKGEENVNHESVSDISDTEDEQLAEGSEGGNEVASNGDSKPEESPAKKMKVEDKDSEPSKTEGKVSKLDKKPVVRKPSPITAPASTPTPPEEVKEEPGSDDGDKEESKKKGSKNYDYNTKLNYLFRDTRFFLVKSNNLENVEIAKSRGVWSTPSTNETKYNMAYGECRNVLLLFSVKESGRFCGLARLQGESKRDGPNVPWNLPPGLSARALGGVFEIDWICKTELSFQKVQHLYNPWNEGKPVKIGRDGQEIETKVAQELCRLFPEDKVIDMTPILRRSKETARILRSKEPLPPRKPGPLLQDEGPRRERGSFRDGRGGGDRGGRGRGGNRMIRGSRGGGDPRGGRDNFRGDRDNFRGDRGRKRGRSGDRGGPRGKMIRYEERRRPPPPMPKYRERSPPSDYRYYDQQPTYEEYLRAMSSRAPAPPRGVYSSGSSSRPSSTHHPSEYMSSYPPQYVQNPPRYYDGVPSSGGLYTRRRSRSRSYDRSVEEFIRRTSRRSRDRISSRRSRSPRSRSRGSRSRSPPPRRRYKL